MRHGSKTSAINRRHFLKSVALSAGAVGFPTLLPSWVLGRGRNVSPNHRITVGCIGVGGRGTMVMKGLLQLPDVRVVAVCDTYTDRKQKAKEAVDKKYGNQDCKTYGDFREIIARRDIDAVMIASQDHWHALIATAAAKAGKHIYCEKPFGVSFRDCQVIRDTVRKHQVVFQTGTQQRSDRKFRQACELARNGYLGKIHTVEVGSPCPEYKPSYKGPYDPQPVPEGFDWNMWCGPAPFKPYNPGRVAWPDWYLISDYCAGFIVNWGVHHLDIASWGCPEIGATDFEVDCRGTYRHEGFTDNSLDWESTLNFASGLKLVYCDNKRVKSGCKFIGDRGWVHVDRPHIESEPESLLEIKLKDSDLHLRRSDNHVKDFVDAIRDGSKPVSDVDAGFRASYLGMVADISARLNRKLKWDVKKEKFVGPGAKDANAMLARPLRAPWKL
jgi:predicted dehydrogenase